MLSCPIHYLSTDKELPSSFEVPTSSLSISKGFWRVDTKIQALGWLVLSSEHLNHHSRDQVTEVTHSMIHSCLNTLVFEAPVHPTSPHKAEVSANTKFSRP